MKIFALNFVISFTNIHVLFDFDADNDSGAAAMERAPMVFRVFR